MSANGGPLVKVEDLKVHFPVKEGFIKGLVSKEKTVVKAVDGVSFSIGRGEILALVGESGSGKTTTGKAILRLCDNAEGRVELEGEQVGASREALAAFRRKAQMIYQDPYQSLNPRHCVFDIVAEPLEVNGLFPAAGEREAKVRAALERAGLVPPEDFYYRYPYELSGGQRQRVAIAAALIMGPKLIVADEPVSMLDASIRTGIIRLMLRERDLTGVSYLFITHDLSLAWLISDRIAVMYLGRIMEIGPAETIVRDSRHPYSRALLEIMPKPGVKRTGARKVLEGETPSASARIEGCRFRSRCPLAFERCAREEPALKELEAGHSAACHLA